VLLPNKKLPFFCLISLDTFYTLGSALGPVGTAIGGLIGSLFSVGKAAAGKTGCDDPSPADILKSVKEVKSGLTSIENKVGDITNNIVDFREENALDHEKTQELITDLEKNNKVNFAITQNLIDQGRFENLQEFGVTQGMIKQGRSENMINFAQTQELVNLGRLENAANFQATQSLITAGQEENRVKFGQTQGMINTGRLENFANFAETKGLIQEGRKENVANFIKTFDLVNQGRAENQVNFKETQNLINTGRLENLAGFAITHSLVQEGRQENLVNFAITQDLVNRGRAENQINFGVTQDFINQGRQENIQNFQVTRDLINLGREENVANFRVTRELINVGRQENLINFAITQDLISQGRWENLANFQAVRGDIQNLRQDTAKGFSVLSQQADRNLGAIIEGRLESANNFKTTFALLDRNQEATNAGRLENFKNFRITQGLISQVNDNLLRKESESKAERFLYFTSTASIIQETGTKVESSVIDAKIEILKAIDKSTVAPVLSKLKTFASYFEGELKDISTLDEEKLVEKLLEPNGVLHILTESSTPKEVNSLYSVLSDIINQDLLIPKRKDDETAFIALDSLFHGLQIYLDVLDFILSSYGALAQHFNVKLDVDLVNKYKTLSELRYSGYIRTLNDGLLNNVLKVLRTMESSGFLDDDRKKTLRIRGRRVDEIRSNLAAFQSYINDINQNPGVITSKPVFNNNISSDVKIGRWTEGREVSYAIQYRTKQAVGKISKFSNKFRLSQGMSNPTITLPKGPDTVQERYIYRQLGDAQPEYVGSVQGSNPVAFTDLDLDLYEAAGVANEDFGLPQVEALVQKGANASTIFSSGKTAFHIAAEQNNAKILPLLLLQGSSGLMKYDLSGKLPLHTAAEVGNLEAVQSLVKLGTDVNALSLYNLNALQLSSMFGHRNVVRYLLSQNSLQQQNKEKNQFHPLHLAVLGGHAEVLDELLSHPSTNINIQNNEGFTAFHHAVSMRDPKLVEALLAKPETDLNAVAKTGLAPIHMASISGDAKIMEKLIKHPKVEKTKTTENGLNILHLAAVNNHTDIIKLILREVPTLVNTKDKYCQSPLHLAVAQQHQDIVSTLLIDGKADINAVTNDGMTALHIAASTYQSDVVSMLLLLGADTSLKTNLGLSPIHYAVWYGRSAVSHPCF
jgi:ankyrin repeat protein